MRACSYILLDFYSCAIFLSWILSIKEEFADGYVFFIILKIFMLIGEYLKFVSLWWEPTELSPNVPVKYYINIVNTSQFFKHAINVRRFKKESSIFSLQYP